MKKSALASARGPFGIGMAEQHNAALEIHAANAFEEHGATENGQPNGAPAFKN
jgi:hypothetical protein